MAFLVDVGIELPIPPPLLIPSVVSMLADALCKHYPTGIMAFHISERETHYVQSGNYIQSGSPTSAVYHMNKSAGAILGLCFFVDRCAIIEVKAAKLQTSRIEPMRRWLARAVTSVHMHVRQSYNLCEWYN